MKTSHSKMSACLAVIGILSQPHPGFSQAVSNTPVAVTGTNLNAAVSPEMAAFGSRGVHVHDPSTIVQCEGEDWLFYTGRGVPSFHSKDLKRWEPGPIIFTNAPPWKNEVVPEHRGNAYWAPDVIHLGDRYLLYYSISTFGKKVSAIGLVTTPTLNPKNPAYKWTDEGEVVRSTKTNDFNTIDPSVIKDGEKLWLSFGSYWSGIKLIQLDPKTGKRIAADSPMYSLADSESIEASYIYPHDGYYYLFLNWGTCCRGTNSTYNIRIGRSKQITGPYLDKAGVDMIKGGGSLFLTSDGKFIGPGHAGIFSEGGRNWFSCHFYDGSRKGLSALAILPLQWTASGWPEIIRSDRPGN